VDEYRSYFEPPGMAHAVVWCSGDSAQFYMVHETSNKLIKTIDICRQKAQKKGGQSAARFGRIQKNQVDAFAKLVAETANQLYLDSSNNAKVASISFGGTGEIYSLTAKSPHLSKILASKLLSVNAAPKGIDELISLTSKLRQQVVSSDATTAWAEFKQSVVRDDGLAVYGSNHLQENSQKLKTVLVSGDEKERAKWEPFLKSLPSKTKILFLPITHPHHHELADYGHIVATSFFRIVDLN
jgi:peptide subunit release factor 1 (eRF1)